MPADDDADTLLRKLARDLHNVFLRILIKLLSAAVHDNSLKPLC